MNFRNPSDFPKKTKNTFEIPEGATLVTAGVIGIYPNTLLGAHLEAFVKRVDGRDLPKVPTEEM